jgi:NTP pyrophosphatase (non-canonical NTP hydrolase)
MEIEDVLKSGHTHDEAVYLKALEKWGEPAQLLMLIEEMGELTVEVAHQLRGRGNYDKLLDECVDVDIMVSQLRLILEKQNEARYTVHKCKKINRLEERLKEREANDGK